MEVMVILPYPPQLQGEHKDPCVLDQDNNIIQESVENKSWSKWSIVIQQHIIKYSANIQKLHAQPKTHSNGFLGMPGCPKKF